MPGSYWDIASRGRRVPCKQRHSYLVVRGRYRRCPPDVHFANSTHKSLGPYLLCCRIGIIPVFTALRALTFHSHRDDKLFPGCTLASVTLPGASFARSAAAAAACSRHLGRTRTCTFVFSLRRLLMRLMRSRRFTSNSPGRKGNLQGANRERAYVKCVPRLGLPLAYARNRA